MMVLFVDLRAAFDKVDREILWKTMRERGIREELVRRCEDMLKETRNKVRIGEERSEQFWTRRGVKQGCPLSSSLFNLLMADPSPPPRSKAEDEEGRMEIRLRGEKYTRLAYADNIVLLAEEEDIRVMIARLERYVREKRLEVNVGK